MEFKIFDGRNEFFQWDLKQKLILEGFSGTIEQVHFEDGYHEKAFVAETYTSGSQTLVNVPSDALCGGGSIKVYAYDIDTTNGDRTLYVQRFIVHRRTKPEDYIYEERDVRHLKDLIRETEDFIENSVDDELDEAKTKLRSYEVTQEGVLDSYTGTKKTELDSYESTKETELNTHTGTKKSELDSYTSTKKGELDSYRDEKKSELDSYEQVKETEIQSKVDSFSDYSQTQARLQALEDMKILYFDNNGYLNYKG